MTAPAPSLSGHLANVLVCTDPEKKRFVTREVPEVQVSFEGFVGDRHAGLTRLADVRTPWFPKGTVIRNTRQVSVVSREELAEVAGTMGIPNVLASWLGANLELVGVPRLTHLPPGTRLFFPEEATLVMEGENQPCIHPGRAIEAHHPDMKGLASRFVKAAWRKRGLVGWVERPGLIRAGDQVRVMLPPPVTYSLPAAPVDVDAKREQVG
ncbi:MOSC domain-containing protein [Corallococcus sp. BB11-1]|uniref:MOSC domain-containing protein n=1 Tax=Corallococcus sp. BB11-1 TaxID=2996783 RepID=UPI0022710C4C|nr:MOSC domain-containing protein [Corallococcus sp. BB11-1]MCY1035037.1 MOSC domain-containing protein [Corallococcus sp. BB11-1]